MRGKIQNVARKQQIIDFSGLLFGSITPTDMDGLIEYHDKAYAILEFKYGNVELPYGQRLCIQRLVNDLAHSGKKIVAAVIGHNVHDVNQSIPAAECFVREVYLGDERRWRPPIRPMTTLELLEAFFDYVEPRIAV